ncbi:MAG: hypothetical protein ABJB34_01075 [Acidobacteriota bacterium]
MNRATDRLYELLPSVYRMRDEEQRGPLRSLLNVIDEQVELVEADIAQTYENWFIETCDDWVVPYIGDLIGYTILRGATVPADDAQSRSHLPVSRRDVANVIRYRRRKGTLALLELLARDAANLPARAVEFYRRLAVNQSINFPHLKRGQTVSIRNVDELDLLDGPFDMFSRTVDMRRVLSSRTRGRFNVKNVGLFVWRLSSYSVTETPAYCVEEEAPECYSFSVLGHDTQLYSDPRPETEPAHIAGELNLPTPIRRRGFEKRIVDSGGTVKRVEASENYYPDSIAIFLLDKKGNLSRTAREAIIPANLSNWGKYRPPRNFVAVDPRLGRIVFPPNQKPRYGVFVSYRYAFSSDIGGGEYDRSLSQPNGSAVYRVGRSETFKTITDAIEAWRADEKRPASAVIEIHDSGVYIEPLRIDLAKNESLQIRAANRRRPVIRLLDYQTSLPDGLTVKGAPGSRFTLDGLLIAGRSVQINGSEQIDETDAKDAQVSDGLSPTADLCEVTIRHCTLVPGWDVNCDCEPERPSEPSLELESTNARINVEHSVIGTILVQASERASEPLVLRVSDSILDATSEDRVALGSLEDGIAYARLTIERTTVIGTIRTHAIELAENSIFKGLVTVARRQKGCVRFCYVEPNSRTPLRYHCQPDLAEQAIEAKLRQEAVSGNLPSPTSDEIEAAKVAERIRVIPIFNSIRYGAPTYCQLAQTCPVEISDGADDESEIGAFHDLYMPQRLANLRTRLDEFSPADAQAGIIIAS